MGALNRWHFILFLYTLKPVFLNMWWWLYNFGAPSTVDAISFNLPFCRKQTMPWILTLSVYSSAVQFLCVISVLKCTRTKGERIYDSRCARSLARSHARTHAHLIPSNVKRIHVKIALARGATKSHLNPWRLPRYSIHRSRSSEASHKMRGRAIPRLNRL